MYLEFLSFYIADGDEGGNAFVQACHEAREQGEESESKVYSMWVVKNRWWKFPLRYREYIPLPRKNHIDCIRA